MKTHRVSNGLAETLVGIPVSSLKFFKSRFRLQEFAGAVSQPLCRRFSELPTSRNRCTSEGSAYGVHDLNRG